MDHQVSRSLTLLTVILTLLWDARSALSATPTGDFVCTRLQTYEVPVTALLRQPYLIRENVWCAKIPPRCVKTRTEYRLDVITENVTKTRVVAECCPGYWLKDETSCAPKCYGNFEGCGDHGKCVASDVCKCEPGFHGAQCNQGYEFHQLPEFSTTVSVSNSPEVTESTPQYSRPSDVSVTVRPTLTMIVPRMTTLQNEPTSTESTVQFEISSSSSSQSPTPTAVLGLRNLNENDASAQVEPPGTETPLNAETESDRTTPEISSTVVNIISTSPPPIASSSATEIPLTQVKASSTDSATQIEATTFNLSEPTLSTDNFYETVNTTEQNSSDTSITLVTKSDKQNDSISNSKFHHVPTVDPEISSVSPKKVSSISHLVVVSNNETSLSNNYFMHMDLMTTLSVIIGSSCAIVLLSLLVVILCQHRANRRKTAPMNLRPIQRDSRSPKVRHSQQPLPPTPLDLNGICSSGGLLIVHQHVTMATTNTFKPGSLQPTISPALREALEAHYDHPAPVSLTLRRQRVSLDPGQRSPSVEALWDAVVNAATASAATEQIDSQEHLYDEIPCWNPQVYANSPCSTLQTSRC